MQEAEYFPTRGSGSQIHLPGSTPFAHQHNIRQWHGRNHARIQATPVDNNTLRVGETCSQGVQQRGKPGGLIEHRNYEAQAWQGLSNWKDAQRP